MSLCSRSPSASAAIASGSCHSRGAPAAGGGNCAPGCASELAATGRERRLSGAAHRRTPHAAAACTGARDGSPILRRCAPRPGDRSAPVRALCAGARWLRASRPPRRLGRHRGSSAAALLIKKAKNVQVAPEGVHRLRPRHESSDRSHALTCCLIGHAREVHACAMTPDGRRVVSAARDRTVRIWDPTRGAELGRLEGDAGDASCCAVTADGLRVVTASRDGTLTVTPGVIVAGTERGTIAVLDWPQL